MIQNKAGATSLYIEWADARLDIMATALLAPAEVKIALSGRAVFVDSSIVDNTYMEIPHSLFYKPPEIRVRSLRRYLATTFAGAGALPVFIIARCLLAGNRPLPDFGLPLYGEGGDGKTSLLLLQANAFRGFYASASNAIFQNPGEFRIAGINLMTKQVVGIDEMSMSRDLADEVSKSVISGGPARRFGPSMQKRLRKCAVSMSLEMAL